MDEEGEWSLFEDVVMGIANEAMYTVLLVSAPVLGVALGGWSINKYTAGNYPITGDDPGVCSQNRSCFYSHYYIWAVDVTYFNQFYL